MFRFVPFSFSDKNIRIKQRHRKIGEIKIESSKKLRYNKKEQKGTHRKGVQMVLVATQVKRRRGTGAENDAFTGAEGEITVDLTNKELRVHTGDNKVGGYGLARKDFENITDEAKNISNWSSNVSNCITNIPQDIKLELNNGTLTLKAGSKVYVPNGFESDGTTPKFDVVTIASDITKTDWGSGDASLFLTVQNGSYIYGSRVSDSGSGTSTESTNGMYYRTNANVIYPNNNASSIKQCFPIAIVTKTNGVPTSIDQVFNGFGYVGSTVFVLPRVSGLIPDGFNSDGTLKNIPFVVENVLTTTGASTDTVIGFVGADSLENHSSTTYKYDPKTNLIVRRSDGVPYSSITGVNRIPFTNPYSQISGQIQYCSFYNVFNAVDYSNTEYIAHQAMPSKRRISLTATNEGSYTAPADGYFVFFATANTSNGYAGLRRSGLVVSMFSSLVNTTSGAIEIPVRKGEVISLFYGNVGSVTFYFEYAQGATNE